MPQRQTNALDKGKVLTLFYIAIFVACLGAALIIPWLFRLLSSTGRAVQRSIFPRSDSGPTGHLKANPTRAVNTDSPASVSRKCAVRSHADLNPESDNSYFGPRKEYSPPLEAKVQLNSAGWISREDRLTSNGRTYKVNRRIKVREKYPKYISKPASWS